MSSLETDEPAGTGEIDVTIAAVGEVASWTLRSGSVTVRVRGEFFEVDGDDHGARLRPVRARAVLPGRGDDQGDRYASRAARSRLATPPANDLPSGAREVSVGTKLNQQTTNAALDMEEPTCLTEEDEEGNEVPLTILRTVWFSLEGTGSPVTIDTAGSGFDTVVAVYTRAADGSLVARRRCLQR